MTFSPIDPHSLYNSDAPQLEVLGSKQTRARHRHEGKGCQYIKLGGRIVYRGSDILKHLEENTVATAA